jgi:heat shock protein HslJ
MIMIAALSALFAGCSPQPQVTTRPAAQEPAPLPTPAAPQNWVITAVNGTPVDTSGLRARPSMQINGSDVTGSTGCNRYSGRLRFIGSAAVIPGANTPQPWLEGPVATTRMACEPAAMALERAITSALAQGYAFNVSGARARLLDRTGTAVLDLEAEAVPVQLSGTDWQLVRIGDMVTNTSRRPTLRIDGNQVSGHSGCNRFGGSITITGDRYVTSAGAMTEMACVDVAPTNLEAAYMNTLWGSGTWSITGRTLTLSCPQGRLVFEAR